MIEPRFTNGCYGSVRDAYELLETISILILADTCGSASRLLRSLLQNRRGTLALIVDTVSTNHAESDMSCSVVLVQ